MDSSGQGPPPPPGPPSIVKDAIAKKIKLLEAAKSRLEKRLTDINSRQDATPALLSMSNLANIVPSTSLSQMVLPSPHPMNFVSSHGRWPVTLQQLKEYSAMQQLKSGPAATLTNTQWDPTTNTTANGQTVVPPNARALKRINRDITTLTEEPVEGIYIVPDDNDVTMVHALICGPKDTPYEGGFFYFVLVFPHDYPFTNPKVKLMTTGNCRVRFNPNLYYNGKVCLSILGTWAGPSWASSYNTRSILLSIQSVMCDEPYFNEPGRENLLKSDEVKDLSRKYSAAIRIDTIRVAGLDMYESKNGDSTNMPEFLKNIVKSEFEKNLAFYKRAISEGKSCETSKLNQGELRNGFPVERGAPIAAMYSELEQRLVAIEANVQQVELLEPSAVNSTNSARILPQNVTTVLGTTIDVVTLDDEGFDVMVPIAKRRRSENASPTVSRAPMEVEAEENEAI